MQLAIFTIAFIAFWIINARFNYYLIECTTAIHRFVRKTWKPLKQEQQSLLMQWNIDNQKWHQWQVAAFFAPICSLIFWKTGITWHGLALCIHAAMLRFAIYTPMLNYWRGLSGSYLEDRKHTVSWLIGVLFHNEEGKIWYLRALALTLSFTLSILTA